MQHSVPQQVVPAPHVVPFWHGGAAQVPLPQKLAGAWQTSLQPPQFRGSFISSTQTPAQHDSPKLQAQVPPELEPLPPELLPELEPLPPELLPELELLPPELLPELELLPPELPPELELLPPELLELPPELLLEPPDPLPEPLLDPDSVDASWPPPKVDPPHAQAAAATAMNSTPSRARMIRLPFPCGGNMVRAGAAVDFFRQALLRLRSRLDPVVEQPRRRGVRIAQRHARVDDAAVARELEEDVAVLRIAR